MRVARTFTVLAAMLLVAAACQPTPSVSSTPSAPGASPTKQAVTITYWHGYNPVETKQFTDVALPLFKQQHPEITVDSQAVPYDDLRKKLLTGIAGGQLPDVLRADIIWVPEFADLGALVAFDESFSSDFNALKAQVFAGPLSTNVWKGKSYGLPLDTNTRVLMWNKEVYAKAGLSAPPKTWDEFKANAPKLGDGKASWAYAEGGTGGWNMLPWIWSGGGSVTDANLTKATGYLNGPESVAALQFLVDLKKAGQLGPATLGGDPKTDVGYAKDQYGNILDGPWMIPIFKDQYPNKQVQLAPMPAGKGGSISVVGGEDIVMFKSSKQQAAAWEFVKFMLSKDAQTAMGKVGQMPVLNELVGSADLPSYYSVFMEQLKTAKARTPHPKWPKIDEAIGKAVTLALGGDKSPQAALDEAAKTVDDLLAGR